MAREVLLKIQTTLRSLWPKTTAQGEHTEATHVEQVSGPAEAQEKAPQQEAPAQDSTLA